MTFDSVKAILEKKYKKPVLTADNITNVSKIPTGIAGLDWVTAGGLPEGRIIHIHGLPSTGKSSTALQIAAQLQKLSHHSFYIDLEHTVTEAHIKTLPAQAPWWDPSMFAYWQAYSAEEAADGILSAIDADYKLIILDSIPFLYPQTELQKLEAHPDESLRVGMVANFLTKMKATFVKAVNENNAILLLINHDTRDIGSLGAGWSPPGGQALKHMTSLSLQYQFFQKDKDHLGRIETTVQIDKSKVSTAFQKVKFVFNNGCLSLSESLLHTVEELKLVNVAAGRYKDASGTQLAHGREKMLALLEPGSALYNEWYALVQEKIASSY